MIYNEDYEVAKALAMVRDYCNEKECYDCIFHNEQKRTCVMVADEKNHVPGAIKMNLSKIEVNEIELKKLKANYEHMKYIAKDMNGEVYLYGDKPHKEESGWMDDNRIYYSYLNMEEYQTLDILLSWDDEEPYEINI
ncbi:MAG: hypothetical protein RR531_12150 [Longicatena sp.]